MKEILYEIANGNLSRLEKILENEKTKQIIEANASRIAKNPQERRELISTGQSIVGELLMRNFTIEPDTKDVEGRFIGYISKTLPKRMIAYVQKGYVKNAVSLDTLADSAVLVDNDFEDSVIDKIDLENAVNSLTRTQQRVIRGIYFDGLTPLEVARQYGISISSVSQAKKRALKILAVKLRNED